MRSASEGAMPEMRESGSIFAAFARSGQHPIQVSHRPHNTMQARAHIVKWVTECNRPVYILSNPELRELLTADRPKLDLPSPSTVQHDIKFCFENACQTIASLLHDHPGHLHFATDTWTSPNH